MEMTDWKMNILVKLLQRGNFSSDFYSLAVMYRKNFHVRLIWLTRSFSDTFHLLS